MAISRRAFAEIASGVVVYAGLVAYLDRGYVDPRPSGSNVKILPRPFAPAASDAGTDYFVKYAVKAPPGTVVYEDKMPLDPLGTAQEDRGPGRFQLAANGVIFSPSDLSDPNTSNHRYWLVLP